MSTDTAPAIVANHYRETVAALLADPIVHDLASGVLGHDLAELAHDSGTPRHEFMGAANREYAARGGQIHGHIGAVAEAVLALLAEPAQMHWFQTGDFTDPNRRDITIAKYRRIEVRAGSTALTVRGEEFTVTAIEERGSDAPDAFRVVTVRPV